jgi:hypothetical protein
VALSWLWSCLTFERGARPIIGGIPPSESLAAEAAHHDAA